MSNPKVNVFDEVVRIHAVLESLISWMAQSANSPISQAEAKILLNKLLDV